MVRTKCGTEPIPYSKNPHKSTRVLGVQADFVLTLTYTQNQPENVLKVFLKLFLN